MVRTAQDATAGDLGNTLVERAVTLIHRDILTGVLRPAAKLRIQELAARYGIGATPIREALSRLSPLGLVQPVGNRGFRARAVSRDDLADITLTRQIAEAGALRRAMERGDADWEAEIVGALHRLKAATQRPVAGGADAADIEFDRAHKTFHLALIAACGSERLIELSSVLYDQAFRYRQVMMKSVRFADDFYDEHARLADEVLRRDVDIAAEHLSRHLASTLAVVYPP